MLRKAFSILRRPSSPSKWDAPRHFQQRPLEDRETAYKVHLGKWSRYL